MATKANFVQGSFFEEDYLIRTLGPLGTYPEIALTELVANAWDAGATKVNITIPGDFGQTLQIFDNGSGLSPDEFHFRWMRLGYNRLKHQGEKVIFPKGNVSSNRMAYGRNGIGRHGLLCFNDEYKVITEREGFISTFVVTTKSDEQPFVLQHEKINKGGKGHGTTLQVIVRKNLPNPDKILQVLSARFLHDPQFIVSINKRVVPLEEHSGLIDTAPLRYKEITLKAHIIDSQRAARSTQYQGIAFWQIKDSWANLLGSLGVNWL
jgi:hypothetical protein